MKTILVLEDDPSNLQVFCALLWSIGYNVLEATTGEEAIEFGKRHSGSIDLFISDVAVPKPSRTEVAVELLKSHPAMPILFVSGCAAVCMGWERLAQRPTTATGPHRVSRKAVSGINAVGQSEWTAA